ncbi:MAG: hypothetical protein ACYTFY_14090 [Planctomycetota bacterium]|jgi:hypothetical protein
MSFSNYRMSVCVDFGDDLYSTWYDRKRLQTLFSFFRDRGMRRIYWLFQPPQSEKELTCSLSKTFTRNLNTTYRKIGELVPAAVEAAHALDMELYAVYKPFEFAFNTTFPFNTKEAEKHGRLDCMSGRIFWANQHIIDHKDKRLKRHPADLRDNKKKKTINTIELTFDSMMQSIFDKDDLQIFVSNDNTTYHQYRGQYNFMRAIKHDSLVLRLEGLQIKEPYLAVKSLLPKQGGHMSNTLDKLVTLYDKNGESILFTYGITGRKGSGGRAKGWGKVLDKGFLFDDTPAAVHDNVLKRVRHAIDNSRNNSMTALAIGKESYIRGALSPAYPAVQKIWMNHINYCLTSGVDGVDLRIVNHNRSLEWERYGFEPPVIKEYKKRYGVDISCEKFNPLLHRKLLGGFYTDFIRKASQRVRSVGKKIQLHIGRTELDRPRNNISMNMYFAWEDWIKEGLADEITIKDTPLFEPSRWAKIARLSRPRKMPAYLCSHWCSIPGQHSWQKKFRAALEESLEAGMSGWILYESAMIVKMDPKGKLKQLNPEAFKIMKDFRSQHKIF